MATLFHVSDIHFGAEDRAAIDWFVATTRAEQPDAVVVTGDLTMRARHAEFAVASRWLESLWRPVTVEVGNHDLPYFNPFARFLQPYARYRRFERLVERPLEIAGVAIVPLRTTARFQWRLDWSKGHVSSAELAGTVQQAEALARDCFTIVAAHHPLVEAGTRGTAHTRGGAAALERLAMAGVRAVLSGHVHDPFDRIVDLGAQRIRLIGAGTLSARIRSTPPSFNELRVAGCDVDVKVRTMA